MIPPISKFDLVSEILNKVQGFESFQHREKQAEYKTFVKFQQDSFDDFKPLFKVFLLRRSYKNIPLYSLARRSTKITHFFYPLMVIFIDLLFRSLYYVTFASFRGGLLNKKYLIEKKNGLFLFDTYF